MAAGIVLTKRWGRPAPLLVFTGWQLLAGGLLLLPVALLVEGLPAELTSTNVLGFAYLSIVGSLIAYAIWFRGIERLPAAAVSFLGLISPVVATVLGYVFLGQTLGPWQVVGMVCVFSAVIVGQHSSRPTRPEPTVQASELQLS